MKLLFYYFLLLLTTTFCFSQSKNCIYEIEEKTDSTTLKTLPYKLVYERVFGSSKDLIQFQLINNNGMPTIGLRVLQKNTIFIPALCLDKKSKIILQLENGKIITLVSLNNEACASLSYDDVEKSNIRALSGYFAFTKTNYEELKKSPIALMRIQFVGKNKDYTLKQELNSELLKSTTKPSTILMDFLQCIE